MSAAVVVTERNKAKTTPVGLPRSRCCACTSNAGTKSHASRLGPLPVPSTSTMRLRTLGLLGISPIQVDVDVRARILCVSTLHRGVSAVSPVDASP